ncbi:IS5/IS1182 family transposase, partial [Oceanobacillus profundus]
LCFTRFSVRGKGKVENELGFAFMAVNLRKYTAMNRNQTVDNKNNPKQNGSDHQKPMIGTIFQ